MCWLKFAASNPMITYVLMCVAVTAVLVLLWRKVTTIIVRRQVVRVLDDRIARYGMAKSAVYTGKNPSKVQ